MKDFVRAEIEATIGTFQRLQDDAVSVEVVARIGEMCGTALKLGKKIMIAGNGGSAADAQHIAAEFVCRLVRDRRPLAALALTTDTSFLTAAANDYGYDQVFARQVEALGSEGDVLIGISTSGRSPNILLALKAARQRNMTTVGLTGRKGVAMADLCDYVVHVPSDSAQNIQEVHIMIGHTICALAEREFLDHDGAESTKALGVD